MTALLAPSMMCVDLMNVERDVRVLESVGVDYLHIDVMDQHFVPNMMLFPAFVDSLREITSLPLDIHLMVDQPESCWERFVGSNPDDIICVHYESSVHVQRILAHIRERGAKAGIALCPATPIVMLEDLLPSLDMILLMTVNPGFAGQALIPGMFEKIARLKDFLITRGYGHIPIEVDGNVSFEHAPTMYANGADILVVGSSSIFSAQGTIEENTAKLKSSLLQIPRNNKE